MKKQSHLLSSALALLFMQASSSIYAEILSGKVINVANGDSLTIVDAQYQQHTVRLSGIDAPEPAQAFGQKSQQSLSNLVFGKNVTIEWDKQDAYHRLVGKVWYQETDINLMQIKQGMAWHYSYYAKDQSPEDALTYAAAEQKAKSKQIGLWADAYAMAPWTWRKEKRKSALVRN